MHESNRQMFMDDHQLLTRLKLFLNEKNDEKRILKALNGCFRSLVLDDDIRVEFGKGK